MTIRTRTLLSAVALAAMMSVAQAQTTANQTAANQDATNQDHGVHHPDGAAATPAQPTPGQPGMPMGMDQMRSMMGGMMGQQNGPSGMMGGPAATMPMMPMMRSMMMGQAGGMGAMGMGAMGLPFEHVEGRIAFLKAELKITDAQAPQWNAFADVLRANAQAQRAMHEQMGRGGASTGWPERLAFQQKALSTRLEALKALEAAARPLYAVLSDEQKALADQLLGSSMGMM